MNHQRKWYSNLNLEATNRQNKLEDNEGMGAGGLDRTLAINVNSYPALLSGFLRSQPASQPAMRFVLLGTGHLFVTGSMPHGEK